MTTNTLDHRTAERLLRGALPPDDAPPGYGEVAALLRAARTEARTPTTARAGETIAAMLAVIEAADRAPSVVRVRRRSPRARLAAVASTGVFVLFGGLTAAGALPSAAQDHVSTVLAKVGIDVPDGDGGGSGSQVDTPSGTDEGPEAPAGDGKATNHGDCVSQVAGSGGAAVSAVAQSDCGKPPTAGGPSSDKPNPGNGPPGGAPPGLAKPEDRPHPTHPPQSNSGGSAGNGTPGGNASPNGNASENVGNPPGQDKTPK